jgi:hypothetical protein
MGKNEKKNETKPEAAKAPAKVKKPAVPCSIKSEQEFFIDGKLSKLDPKAFGTTREGRLLRLRYQKECTADRAKKACANFDKQIRRLVAANDPKAKLRVQIERQQAQLAKLRAQLSKLPNA